MARRWTAANSDQISFTLSSALAAIPTGALTFGVLWRPASSHRGGLVKLTQSGSIQAGCNPFDGAGHLFFSVNGSGDAGDYTADIGTWRQDWFTKPAGTGQLRHHRYRYASPGWAHTDLGSVGNGGTANEAMVVGLFASGQFLDASVAAMIWYAANLSDGTLEGAAILTSYPAWLGMATPAGAWKFNQASVATAVLDDSGNGADQSAISGTTVTDDPAGFSYTNTIVVGTATETDTAQSVSRLKSRTVGTAAETDTAAAVGRLKTKAIGRADTTDTAQAINRNKMLLLGTASDLSAAVAFTRRKTRELGVATETDLALAFSGSATPARPAATAHLSGPQRAAHYGNRQTATAIRG